MIRERARFGGPFFCLQGSVPRAEQGRSDPDMRRPDAHCGRIIIRHAHRQTGKAMIIGQLGQQGKPRGWFQIHRRDCHQAHDRHIGEPRRFEQGGQIGWRTAALLLFPCEINLHKAGQPSPHLIHCAGERLNQTWPIKRMDYVEQAHCLFCLVTLQLSDQMEHNIGMVLTQDRPFSGSFLDSILSKDAMAHINERPDRV